MAYTINQLAKIATISVRTLHHYDEIGLLNPSRLRPNGYREYEEAELLKLQQILFFRELDFPLAEIKRIISSPHFNMRLALTDQRQLIELKKKRLDGLIATIDKTLKKITHHTRMHDNELYTSFDTAEEDQYAAEAKARWGHTEAYKQSQERYKKMSKDDIARIKKESDELMKKIVANRAQGAQSPDIQQLIAQHYNNLRHFYEPNLEMYRGLAEMYVADPRFTAYYEKYDKNLAQFMKEAMCAFCDAEAKK